MVKNMGITVALQTFGVIFLAEMADKTQLATIMMASRTRQPVSVFVGAALALVLVSSIGVVFGEAIARVIPAQRMKQIAGVVFVGLGVFMLASK